ncbi:MAG: hypothetical protein FJ098_06105, partial [Deltaproteobacteria bacterium]|nr:hypothetical protein [Deltaproteobacteria bacterium]
PGGEGPGLFLVDGGSPGVEWRGRTPALGLRSVRVADLVLHGVQALARLDRPGQGRAVLDSAVQADRIAIAAQATGLAGGVFQATLRHLQGGTSDGRALPSVGTVQALVADAAAELDAARLLTWNAALRLDAGEDADEASAMACLQASRCARELTDTCLRLWGGEGALDDALPARAVGDARLAVMRGGSEELMRAIVARHLLERLQVAGTLP